ncbi:hypothetical protein [Parvularcula lutaonensis]|uniref:DUF3667 domain-containing protein n=1 Tax=Parvularcula lutaonensis TaxID=491923 RepID=A0ABV7MEC1_9PROT|nr:hypothetical protein [Parvularcula lutaonensis]GGY54941.1 hypothetical protein GCM10007148_25870 [Parvularcula lutaonensis]
MANALAPVGEIAKKREASLSLDTVLEDLFGLNVRGLKTVAVLWRHPARYFEAARSPDLEDRYTPSIRLWLSFFALYSALKFWWLGGNDGMIEAYAAGFEAAHLVLPEGMTYRDVGQEAVLGIFGAIPILQIITMVLLTVLFPFWGERTPIALRQRKLFAVIVPSTSLMPVFMTLMMVTPSGLLTLYGVGLAIVTMLIDFQTAYRGAICRIGRWAKLWRAALLAFVIVSLNVLTSVGAQIAGIVLIGNAYGTAPPG